MSAPLEMQQAILPLNYTILVFMKFPEPGKVKTRLAAGLGIESAAALYREWIGRVLSGLQPLRCSARIVGFATGAPLHRFGEWDHQVDAWLPQPDGDLGKRLQDGFAWGLAAGPT